MEPKFCIHCGLSAAYICSCPTQNCYFCRIHLELHELTTVSHRSKNYLQETQIPNPISKEKIIKAIHKLKTNTIANKNIIIGEIGSNILLQENDQSLVLDQLSTFIILCENIIDDIEKIQQIPIRPYYNPLEAALISQEIEYFINKFDSPALKFEQNKYFYIPSVFPHFLYNYAHCTTGMPSSSELKIHPINKIIVNEDFDWSSRFLQLNSNKLLITGGLTYNDTNCFVLNIATEQLTQIKKMNIDRKWHGMAWIDGNPAVIGGFNGFSEIRSVEVLKDSQWVNASDINIARDNLKAISFRNTVYIFGGAGNGFDEEFPVRLDSIEKYENSKWTVLNIKLNQGLSSSCLVCVGFHILVFGGYNSEKMPSNTVFSFNLMGLEICELEKMENFLAFYSDCFFTVNELNAFGHQNEDNMFLFDLKEYIQRFGIK